MEVEALGLDGLKLIRTRRFGDQRGYFAETWNRRLFAAHGLDTDFVQDNVSLSRSPGTIRGLHYQTWPFAQAKLIRVVRGAILDVAVDLRRSSPTFGRHVSVVLSAEGGEQLFIPVGFAHGLCTLEADTEVAYKVSDFYSPEHDAGIIWNDPDLAIDWRLGVQQPTLSEKDATLPRLASIEPPF
jgi:dTDP-4-dehydrorhamnose 3,5-epimerase